MENENVKEEIVEAEANDVDVDADDVNGYDENLGINKEEVREKSLEERVEVEEPKEKTNPFKDMSMETINIILSIGAIAICLIGQLFASIGLGIVFTIFFWIGIACLIASLAIYIVQIIKDKKVAFTPNLVLLILACLLCAPSSIMIA